MAEGGDSPRSPNSTRMALAGKSVEDLMTKLTSNQMAKNVSTLRRRLQVEDCLNAAEKTTQSTPKYAVRAVSPTVKGISFGTANKDFQFSSLPGNASPGPCYASTSFTDHPNHPQSFPKASRFLETGHGEEGGPGPQYEVPGAFGRQLTRSSAPGMKVGNGPRFTDAEYISPAHCKSMGGRGTPAPSAYNVDIPASAASYSFASGGRDVKAGKLFISKAHAEREVGTDSPGPMYMHSHEFTSDGRPLFAAPPSSRLRQRGGRAHPLPKLQGRHRPHSATSSPKRFDDKVFISRLHSKAEAGFDSPGPGTYGDVAPAFGKGKPSFTFGGSDAPVSKRFYSKAHVSGYGTDSPGPQYKPDERHVMRSVPGCVFADPDPLIGSMNSRFADQHKVAMGNASPGPAAYTLPLPSTNGPAFSMARKEKILMKRICPAPERARFFSKELAKENCGAYSPGPKYLIPGTIGGPGSAKHSFGISDRAYEDLALEQRDGMVFTAPSEARFISRPHAKSLLGKFSPGPKYNPNIDAVTKRIPAASITGRWKDTPAPKPTKEELEEERKRAKLPPPSKDAILPNPSRTKFGTSKRGLLAGEESKAKTFAGKDSPGPVYRPNFESVDPHRPNIVFGSLR